MKSACFVWLLLFLAVPVFGQSNPVYRINQPTTIVSLGAAGQTDPKAQAEFVGSYAKLPLSFEANHGQIDARVKFLSRGSGYTLFLTRDEAVFSLRGGKGKSDVSGVNHQMKPSLGASLPEAVLRMKLVKANSAAKVSGTDELPAKSNYFIGNDRKKWNSNVPTYGKVKYEGVYPGIDLVYYGTQRQLEYDFVVAPGADPHRIQFDVRGAKKIRRDPAGDLVLQIGKSEVRWRNPAVYQEKDGLKQQINGRYVIEHGHRVGFEVAAYDATIPLIIDPAVGYSTYLGGSGIDYGIGVTVDSAGNAYITGLTSSVDFPTTPGAFQTKCGGACSKGNSVAFVTKLNPTGSALVYSTYLGGTNGDYGIGIAVDSLGNAHIAGFTQSSDFPVTAGAFQTTCPTGCGSFGDAFVTEINSDGTALVYSTYLGGSGLDTGNDIALDASGNAYVTGYTTSTDFPTLNPLQPTFGGGSGDTFVAKVNPSGSALVYSTYLGGSSYDYGNGIAVDASGNAYVTGSTTSANFPMTPGAFQTTCAGGCSSFGDAFVTEINSSGSALVYSTYLGGSLNNDYGTGIVVDASGNAYVNGVTESADFPTTPGAFQTTCGGGACGGGDAFVAKINPGGSALVYSTHLGGSGEDLGYRIAVDGNGNAYVTGRTYSADFPTMNPLQPTYGGNGDAFVTILNPTGTALVYSTYLGGNSLDQGAGIALDASGNAFVLGTTFSPTFPVTSSSIQTTCNGGCTGSSGDAFVAKFVPGDQVWPLNLSFGNQSVGTSSNPQNTTLVNSGTTTLAINSINVTGINSGDFSETNGCGTALAVGASCTISVTFAPTAPFILTAAVTIADSAPNSPQTVLLSGTGTGPVVTLSPPSLTFGSQTVGMTSSQQVSTLTNTGNATLTISTISVTGTNNSDFVETNTCGTSLAVGSSCSIVVTFTPQATGSRIAAVTITDNASSNPQALPLSGTGVLPAVTLSPTSLIFPDQVVFTTSRAKTLTITNIGLGILTVSSIAVSGPFSQTNNCKTVNPSASCAISVTFKPTVIGVLTGSVSITDNAPGSPQKAPLKGTGTYIQLTPASVNFGNQPVGTKSLPKKITLSNKGSVAVSITSISVTGANAGDFAQTNTCGTTVAAGASCFITVTFTPSAKARRSAAISVSDNGGGSPQKVTLAGTGT